MTQGGETQKTLADVLEIVRFLKDNCVTREELYAVRDEMSEHVSREFGRLDTKIDSTKQELRDEIVSHVSAAKQELRDEIVGHVDGFVRLYQNHDAEVAALRAKFGRLEEHVVGSF